MIAEADGGPPGPGGPPSGLIGIAAREYTALRLYQMQWSILYQTNSDGGVLDRHKCTTTQNFYHGATARALRS